MDVTWTSRLDGPGRTIEDRVRVIAGPEGLVVVVADGAGGTGNGAHAAETVVGHVEASLPLADETLWVAFLTEADQVLSRDPHYGEATAVVLLITSTTILGASVGDSEAWAWLDGIWVDLTARQVRKPLVGSGAARPVGFAHPHGGVGSILVGTDGLFKYSRPAQIRDLIASAGPLDDLGPALVDLVRLRTGGLQDDVGLAVIRFGPKD